MKKSSIFSSALIVLGVSGTASAAWTDIDFNKPGNIDNAPYLGTFNYNGQTYGPSTALNVPGQASPTIESKFDLKQLKPFTFYGKERDDSTGHNDVVITANTGSAQAEAPVVYRFYRQKHSAAIINLSRGTEARHFAKAVVGEKTAAGTLVNGTYNYKGVAFTHFPRGDFNYQVKVTGPSSATGEGSFSLKGLKIPARQSYNGQDIYFDINRGTLNSTALAATSAGLRFDGSVTVAESGVSDAKAWKHIDGDRSNPSYRLTLYGPKGAEIGGVIQDLPSRVGTAALMGRKQ
ncbi:hypothetical protein [Pusillimonas sp. ANT_WB101]|uniref:hypothetical protein n=1 Tax=Pusillimonas sp. ANT_WB101 TaxID=2597356 RepID=UPI0011ED1E95|nr:hypothetical protein [Pusillimonas sp. ANT_WB101]KAA0911593.1 hypothetical protein FQ179_07220 [Pusillimonas sp. ANT_WB101]